MNEITNLVVDVETSTRNKGNCYSDDSYLVSMHAYDGKQGYSFPYHEASDLNDLIKRAKRLIFFNAKFDLAWLRSIGINCQDKEIWDVQLAHFILSRQTDPFPSLNKVREYYGLPLKLDVVKKEYWDKGIDTKDVPWDILSEYGEDDCEGTYNCFVRQLQDFDDEDERMYKLFKLSCMDTHVLQEMEWNGLVFNEEMCKEKSNELSKTMDELISKLNNLYPDVTINYNSSDQLSAFLYGGTILEERRELIGHYKTGAKIGQPRYRVVEVEHTLPQLFKPLEGSEMAKEGVYSTAEGTLRKLKGKNKWIIEALLSLAKLAKLNETYFVGLPKLNAEMKWPPNKLHGQYNQCRAVSGRLSSSKPNQQNLSGDALVVMETRFK